MRRISFLNIIQRLRTGDPHREAYISSEWPNLFQRASKLKNKLRGGEVSPSFDLFSFLVSQQGAAESYVENPNYDPHTVSELRLPLQPHHRLPEDSNNNRRSRR
jgi:hypothetical protein